MSTERKQWLAIYSRPRWEKKVARLLQEKGVECYCPLNKVKRQWSDRIKTVEEPLFKSYVFVKVSELEMSNVRLTPGVVNFVYWLGKPAVIKEKEILLIRKFLDDYFEVEAVPQNIHNDAKVRIKRGAFMDKVGVVQRLMKNKIEVVIESIGFKLTAIVKNNNVEVLYPAKIKKSL